jgi:hypothetical protein
MHEMHALERDRTERHVPPQVQFDAEALLSRRPVTTRRVLLCSFCCCY